MWASIPTKIKPMKICTHKELATVITVGYSYPQNLIPSKIKPTKYCDHENLYVYGTCCCNCCCYYLTEVNKSKSSAPRYGNHHEHNNANNKIYLQQPNKNKIQCVFICVSCVYLRFSFLQDESDHVGKKANQLLITYNQTHRQKTVVKTLKSFKLST